MYQYNVWVLAAFMSEEFPRNEFVEKLISIFSSVENSIKVELLDDRSQYKLQFKLVSDSPYHLLKRNLGDIAGKFQIDLIIKPWDHRQISPGLLIMDMDSTLVQAETIDEIARVAGVGKKVAEITESAMRGELDFTESLIARVSMLKDISVEAIESVHGSLPLTEGASNLLGKAKANGCHTALVSGGFTMFAGPIARSLDFDTLSANTLEVVDGKLTGKVLGDIVDGDSKLHTLKKLKHQLGLESEQIVAIGDGANDLPMLSAAGTGIAFHAKPRVQQQASAILNFNNLNAVCWLLNW